MKPCRFAEFTPVSPKSQPVYLNVDHIIAISAVKGQVNQSFLTVQGVASGYTVMNSPSAIFKSLMADPV
ncbi:MAG: hypothetical protein EOP88_22720 [Verrucomicrobiaceae bacterium]|nr:MAG: hypothetical protein EOP88_22720 [Verrucomicrobiaceae bacterium]